MLLLSFPLISDVTKCNIPQLYMFMTKVMKIAMDAHVVNEFRWTLDTEHCRRRKHPNDTPETRAKEWNQWATA